MLVRSSIKLLYRILSMLLIAVFLTAAVSACGKEAEEETSTTVEETTTERVTKDENYIPTVTALGITVPQNLGKTNIDIYDCVFFEGPLITQDGRWEWIDAEDTTPQRGDLVVYYNNEDYVATHEAICVKSYEDGVYMNVDGNYDEEPGGIWKGRFDTGVPNKSWPDSYPKYPGTEIGKGVWRCKDPEDAEAMALAAEAVYEEYNTIGQENFLKKYIPELYYGVWCYYLIPIAINTVASHKVDIPEKTTPGEAATETSTAVD